MPLMLPPIARALAVARSALGVRQEEMARRLGISRRTLSRWERGHIVPSLDDRVRVLAALGDSPRSIRTPLGVAFGLLRPESSAEAADASPELERAIEAASASLGVEPMRFRTVLAELLELAQRHGVNLTAACARGARSEEGPSRESTGA